MVYAIAPVSSSKISTTLRTFEFSICPHATYTQMTFLFLLVDDRVDRDGAVLPVLAGHR